MNIKLSFVSFFVSFFLLSITANAAVDLSYDIERYPSIAKEGETFDFVYKATNIGDAQAKIRGCIVGGSIVDGSDRQNEPTIQGIRFAASAPNAQYFEGTKAQGHISYGALGFESLSLSSQANSSIPFEYMYLNPGESLKIVETVELSEDVIVNDIVQVSFTCRFDDQPFGSSAPVIKEIKVINEYPFSDINTSVFRGFIFNLKQDGIVNGYSDGTYRPIDTVTRAQMANYIVKSFGFTQDASGETFSDVTDMTNDTNKNVQTLKNLGIIGGFSDGTYRPGNNLTRAELTKFVYVALEKKGKNVDPNMIENFPDVSNTNVFKPYIAFLVNVQVNGDFVISGYSDGTYHPDEPITRGAMAKVIDISRKL